MSASRPKHPAAAPISRRRFVGAAASAIAFRLAAPGEAACAGGAGGNSPEAQAIVDSNVTLGVWPLRRLRYDNTAALAEKLKGCGVSQAWAGSFEALLGKDLRAANARLAEECKKQGAGILRPFGSVNPASADWERELERCAQEHRMLGIRLYPNYHGYKLDDPAFACLMARAVERNLIVQIALQMEDERMMHPLLRVEPADAAPLAEIVKQTPGARVVLLNALGKLRAEPLTKLLAAGEVCVEIAMLEGVGGIERLLESVPESRVDLGSHAPRLTFESAMLKHKE